MPKLIQIAVEMASGNQAITVNLMDTGHNKMGKYNAAPAA